MGLEGRGQLSFEDIELLMEYVDARLAKKVSRQDLASRLRSPSQRGFCLRTAMKHKKQQQQQQKEEDFRQSASSKASVLPEIGFSPGISTLTKNSTNTSPVKLSIANTSSTTTISNDIWSKFMDEYKSFDMDLKDNERSMWLATMNVKIKLAENLDKSINASTSSKKFTKLGTKDIFERWSRNLKTELNTIPLCAGRLETGPLVHPRVEPRPEYYIFMDEDGKFDSELFQAATMLYTLVDMLREKVTTFIYATLTYCMTDNSTAQEVVRSNPEDFHILYVRLRERFQKNTDVEKERLLSEFDQLKPGPRETTREYYGRINTLGTELRNVFQAIITDDMIRRAFFRDLPDTAKNNFLQLQVTEPYASGPLHDLITEVIARHEKLHAMLSPGGDSVNLILNNKAGDQYFKGQCNYCRRTGHKES